MSDMKHTPPPWKIIPLDPEPLDTSTIAIVGDWRIVVDDDNDGMIGGDEDDAELIVRAVNSFGDLLAACELAESVLDELVSEERDNAYLSDGVKLKAVRAAIAKAKGETR